MNIQSLLYLYKIKKNLHLKPKHLQETQLDKLKAILKHAYENVPFYHRKFQQARIRPEDVKSVADLSKLPLTSKSEIQRGSLEIHMAKNFDLDNCIKRTTSGSTGLPLTTVIDEKGNDFEVAIWTRTLLENGLKLRDKMAVIGDPRHFPKKRSFLERLGIVSRKSISIFDNAKRQVTFLEDYNPDVIKSYPSSLAILADAVRNDAHNIKPRLLFTSAELLDSESRKFINSAFENEVLDNYACSEFSLLAWECHEHMGYHINIDNVVMEFLKDGEVVAPGERGEIVCTGLINYAMPLIRYRLGDVGIPQEEECSCGRKLPLMKLIEGRKDDFLMALDGRIISPTVFFPYPFENMDLIRQFKVIQERRDRLTIQVVMRENNFIQSQMLESAKINLQKLFGNNMQVEFQILEKIDEDTKKQRKVISNVPVIW
jgi:phenylacetate-CoA ligase